MFIASYRLSLVKEAIAYQGLCKAGIGIHDSCYKERSHTTNERTFQSCSQRDRPTIPSLYSLTSSPV
ncbi:MAG: hypothetical protein KME31_36675 [Tolypothrix carrinoi HA7290-LM1]|nr:hypothetical protein [Tolypothrix carrinoi HA7290-LM1]